MAPGRGQAQVQQCTPSQHRQAVGVLLKGVQGKPRTFR